MKISLDGTGAVSLEFKWDQSESTLFGLNEYDHSKGHSVGHWSSKRIRIGTNILFKSPDGICKDCKYGTQWVEGHVIAIRDSGFGTEMRLIYDGFADGDYCVIEKGDRIHGETKWIAIESNIICSRNCNEHDHRLMTALDATYHVHHLLTKFCSNGIIGDFRVSLCETPRVIEVDPMFEKREKSRQKKQRKRMRMRARRGKRGDDKRSERKMRKYGQIPKYAV